MKSHFEQLLFYIPELASLRVLDVGSGRGVFLIEAVRRGAKAIGVEKGVDYIEETKRKAAEVHVTLDLREGVAESLFFLERSFDFVNASELIEHVEDPTKVLREIYRVLDHGGRAYISIPNRYGFKDPHFHLYGVNWLPRLFADRFISVFGQHKSYDTKEHGFQRLFDMHYMTYREAERLLTSVGFTVTDSREIKIKKFFPKTYWLLLPVYWIFRFGYLDTFHFLVTKA